MEIWTNESDRWSKVPVEPFQTSGGTPLNEILIKAITERDGKQFYLVFTKEEEANFASFVKKFFSVLSVEKAPSNSLSNLITRYALYNLPGVNRAIGFWVAIHPNIPLDGETDHLCVFVNPPSHLL